MTECACLCLYLSMRLHTQTPLFCRRAPFRLRRSSITIHVAVLLFSPTHLSLVTSCIQTLHTKTMSNVDNQDKEALLAALNAYGQNFLESFGLTPQASTSNTKPEPKRKRRKLDHGDSDNSSNEDEDEWGGFGGASGSDLLSDDSEDDFSEDEDLSEGEDNEETSTCLHMISKCFMV